MTPQADESGAHLSERRLSSISRYTGRILSVREEVVLLPNGREGRREVVEHAPVVVVVPVDAEGQLLFVRQYRYPVQEALLELPAGGIEVGEEPAQAAARELAEETGVAPTSLTALGNFYASPGFCTEYFHAFVATGLSPVIAESDEDEFIEVERYSLAEALALLREGRFRDAKTLACLLLYLDSSGRL